MQKIHDCIDKAVRLENVDLSAVKTSPVQYIPDDTRQSKQDCPECKGTGWYTGLSERSRCTSCCTQPSATVDPAIYGS